MSIEENSRALEVWEQDLTLKAENTKAVYRRNFKRFLERWDMTAEELYEMRLKDVKSEDPRDHQNIERMCKILMSEMMEEGYAAGSARNISKSLASFFESQGMPFNIKAKDKPKGAYNGQRLALKGHIRKMWDSCPIANQAKNRAILMFLKDSGLRVSDVSELRVRDFLEAKRVVQNGEKFAVLPPLETIKQKVNAHIHIGPEAIEAVETYLQERQNVDPEEYLFLNRFGDKCSPNVLVHLFLRLGDQVEAKSISAHSLRKFHTTMLESAGVPENWIKKLQGKTISGSMGSYSLPEETGELTKAYIEAYPKLRIFEEQASVQQVKEQADEIESLRQKNRELEAELAKRDDRLSRVEGQVSELIRELREMKKSRSE